MILIFTRDNDISTSDVVHCLLAFNEDVLVIGNENHPIHFSYIDSGGIYFSDATRNKTYNLLEAKSVWWRRTGLNARNLVQTMPEHFQPGGYDLDRLVQGQTSLLRDEIADLRFYINTALYMHIPRHLGNPNCMDMNRLIVLDMAKKVGLTTPNFAIITNYNQLQDITSISDTFVVKAINNGIYDFHDNMAFYSYTEAMNKKDFRDKDIPLFPSLVMSIVEKQYEIRSFFLAGEFYSMAIFSQSNKRTEVDFRKYDSDTPNKNEPYKLPQTVEDKLKKLYEMFNLNTGSADLIVDKNGDYVFLEINPVGQFQMTSLPCNYNLEQKIADYLAK